MILNLKSTTSRERVFESVEAMLRRNNFKISKQDSHRPWGGFFVLDESDAEKFITLYFPEFSMEKLCISGKLSPKILIVSPSKRLSWQYHLRRAEIWKLIAGTAAVATSDTDEEKPPKELAINEILLLKQGERHRLVGLGNWGIVAEIWRHTDIHNPSDENDIIRVQDDFGR